VAVRTLVQHAVAAERVDVRRGAFRVTVRGQAVGAQRVDGDEDDRRLLASLLARAGDQQREQRQETSQWQPLLPIVTES
jgi:hypothetical protein